MIDLFKVRMSSSAPVEVSKVLTSGYISQGPVVDKFEDLLWEEMPHHNTKPVAVNSCTSAIDLAITLSDVYSGDEVISTPQTCFATNVGAINKGATIRWADVDPVTGLIDPRSIEKILTKKTKAILAVNWAGHFADYAALKQFGVPVVEDAAHTWDVVENSSLDRGDYVCYSLQAIKFLTSSDGGILITPKEKENDARMLRWYGLDRTKNESFRCTQNITKAGFKFNMNDVSATIGICNIPEAKKSVDKHRKNARIFNEEFKNLSFINQRAFDEFGSYWLYSIVLKEGFSRDAFEAYLAENGIASSQVHFRNDKYDSTIKFSEEPLLGLEYFSKHQTNIPVGWWLTDTELEHIINTVKKYEKVCHINT